MVVDDEKLIVKGLRFSLEQDGMEVDCAYDGEEAINLAKQTEYDVVLLDVMLPKYDGFEVCQAIREFSEMPVIMLTAKGGDMDKILGLEYGADDYITKPFNILEVKARIKAIMRRSSKKSRRGGQAETKMITAGDLKLDREFVGDLETEMIREFFYAVSYGAEMNLHLKQLSGSNNHHIIEGAFKAFAKALDSATRLDGRITDVLSTKGVL